MEGISSAMARIDAIRSQLGMPAAGSFQATLDAQMSSGSITPVESFSTRTRVSTESTVAMSSQDLQAYLGANRVEERNGHLAASELEQVSGGWKDRTYALLPPAASAYEKMRAAAAADGVDLRVIDAYRSYESQAAAYSDYLAGRKKEVVAPPGTSQHGNGLAVDITNGGTIDKSDPEWQWLDQNAARFGWYPISIEAWHWEFRGV
jgi:LAS superfamily LD-carboxypeptidase LdcB